MFGIRIWDGEKMIYPTKFSVITDYTQSLTSFKIQSGISKGTISEKPMFLTVGQAVNGAIYELDIVVNKDHNVGVVRFSDSEGRYFVNINNENIPITRNMYDYEIIGNIYENKDHVKVFTKNDDAIPENGNQEKEQHKNSNKTEEKDAEKQEKASRKDKSTTTEKIEKPVNVEIYSYAKQNKEKKESCAVYIMKAKDLEKVDHQIFKIERTFAEIEMLIRALKALKKKCVIDIYTTNKLIVAPFEQGWIYDWFKNDWKKANGQEVKNKKYWENLYREISRHEHTIHYREPGSSIVELLRCEDICNTKEGDAGKSNDKK